MRSFVVTASLLLLVACESAGGGADVLKGVGGAAGQGGAKVSGAGSAGEAGAGGDEGELPPPEEDDPPGAGGTKTGTGGSDTGSGGSDAGGANAGGSDANGGKGGASGGNGSGKGGSAGAPDGTGADCNAEDGWPTEARAFECEVLDLVNAQRAAGATCGGLKYDPVPALTMHPILRKSARGHAKDMADKGYFDHASPDGSSSGDRMKAAGYEGSFYGENIAHGQDDPAAVMKSWMGSSPHCKGIMAGKYKHLGVGFAATSDGDTYWVQNFAAP